MADPIAVLCVGDLDRAEFFASREVLQSRTRLTRLPHLLAAIDWLQNQQPPDLVVLAQAFPGEYLADEVAELTRRAPLARVVALVGSWCEGEARSGKPLVGVARHYWHQWPARLSAQLDQWERGDCPDWSRPLTASPEEPALAGLPNVKPDRGRAVLVYGRSRQAVDAWRSLLSASGWATAQAGNADAVVWDTDCEEAAEGTSVQRVRDLAGGAPLVAVVGFPRSSDVAAMLAAGVSAVVSKPLRLCDLTWQLRRLCGATASETSIAPA